jgi:mannose-6-phosphate isomerase-like protein (cupin superfamily)
VTSHDDRITVGSEQLTVRVSTAQSGGSLFAFEVEMPPGGGPPALHRHDSFELYRVHSGAFTFYLERADGTVTRKIAEAGTVVPIPGGREHTVRNESAATARALVVFAPGAEMEGFARDAGALVARGDAGPAELTSLARAHGIQITRGLEEVG